MLQGNRKKYLIQIPLNFSSSKYNFGLHGSRDRKTKTQRHRETRDVDTWLLSVHVPVLAINELLNGF